MNEKEDSLQLADYLYVGDSHSSQETVLRSYP